MRVLVTGAAGLLGTEVCLQLRATGHEVVGIDNLKRYELLGEESGTRQQADNVQALVDAGVSLHYLDFRAALKAEYGPLIALAKADAVVHTAAQVCHSRKGTNDNPLDDVTINILGTVELLQECRQRRVPLLFISSSKVYGENFDRQKWVEVDETCPLGDGTHITFFGASKVAADLFCQMYAAKYGLKVGVFRPGCFTGKWALAAEAQNWLPWLVHCARNDRMFHVFGDGSQVRDLLHVSDLARACILWLKQPKSGVWNLGGGATRALTINTAITQVSQRLEQRIGLAFHPKRPGDIHRLVLDSGRFASDYGWKANRTLDDILTEACA